MPILALEICGWKADDQLSVTFIRIASPILVIFELGEPSLFTEGKNDGVLDDLRQRSHVVAVHRVQRLQILPYFCNVFRVLIFPIIKQEGYLSPLSPLSLHLFLLDLLHHVPLLEVARLVEAVLLDFVAKYLEFGLL